MRRLLAGALALGVAAEAGAHGFGRLYNLPVPFWLYAWAAGAALVLSFLLVAYFATQPPPAAQVKADLGHPWPRGLRQVRLPLQMLSVGLLLLCILTGFLGSRDPYRNFSMTFFWVWFLLGFAYLTALIGNFYAVLNPWRVLAQALERTWPGATRGRVNYPAALGDAPALLLYLVFIWFELFGIGRPFPLAVMLSVYTALNLLGVWLIGSAAWFRHGEFFAVFFRLLGQMAPLHARGPRLHLRAPLAGLWQGRPARMGTAIFVLAMLSTTAFDGLRATQWWVRQFWGDPTGLLTQWLGKAPIYAYAQLRPWYIGWETLWLFLSPFLYFGLYLLALALAKGLTRSTRPLRELALDFAYPLLPIALVYSITHYSTLLLTQGLKLISLASDPFGWGWNLFGSAGLLRAPILPDMGWVWHSQVGLILVGHILGVYASHRVALRIFPTRGAALLSQLPMLALMVAFTVAGLWIIAQPLTAELMR